ncbi:hypothetical protein TrST_g7425 [Triparma strigata]|uniref:Uncharacterized protein n=1 Tax=Triparma strigata TaxID=1606541 RepID=A0A9W6ZKL8_9STRA|nr:hypothetical protein TrST_g7425 [Triparma strigata]
MSRQFLRIGLAACPLVAQSIALSEPPRPSQTAPSPPPPNPKFTPKPAGPLNSLRSAWIKSTWADARHFRSRLGSKCTSSSACLLYPSLAVGLERRVSDELRLRGLGEAARAASEKNDRVEMGRLAYEMTKVAYGCGVTPNARQAHLERFGCVEWTTEALEAIKESGRGRGVVEMGAGNGQWSRKLREEGLDILSFDNMSGLPLNLNLYHSRTKPNAEHFDQLLRKADESILKDKAAQTVLKGRVLLLVFPDPTKMAIDTLNAYKAMGSDSDCFIYVGEGRGGCNANDDFFDELESPEWSLERVVHLKSFGGKGFEKLFVWRRTATTASTTITTTNP